MRGNSTGSWTHSSRTPELTKITDRSGWTNQDGLHRFTLAELEPGHEPENPIRKMVVVTLVQQQGGMVYTKHLDESSGPAKTDCPMRILKQTREMPASERQRREMAGQRQGIPPAPAGHERDPEGAQGGLPQRRQDNRHQQLQRGVRPGDPAGRDGPEAGNLQPDPATPQDGEHLQAARRQHPLPSRPKPD